MSSRNPPRPDHDHGRRSTHRAPSPSAAHRGGGSGSVPSDAGVSVRGPADGNAAVVAFSLKRKKLPGSSRSSPFPLLAGAADDDRTQKRRRRGVDDAFADGDEDDEGDRSGTRECGAVELITGFKDRQTQSLRPKEVESPLVIPVQPNTHTRLRRPGYLPESQVSTTKAFGGAGGAAPTVLDNVGATYGLQRASRKPPPVLDERRDVAADEAHDGAERKEEEDETGLTPEQLLERQAERELREESQSRSKGKDAPGSTHADLVVPVENDGPAIDEAGRYRADVATCPDESTLDDYERIPVSAFGAAVLRGMGWKEGRVIGKNPRNALVRPVEFLQRPKLLGLGAQPVAPSASTSSTKMLKPGETREPKHFVEHRSRNGS